MSVCHVLLQQLTDFRQLLLKTNASLVHEYLEINIQHLNLFIVCQDPHNIRQICHRRISLNVLMRCVHKLTVFKENHIPNIPRDNDSIILDGWTAGDTKYIETVAFSTPPAHSGYTNFPLGPLLLKNGISL